MVLKTLTQSADISNIKYEFPQREKFPQSETHQLGICNGPEILPSKFLNAQGGTIQKM